MQIRSEVFAQTDKQTNNNENIASWAEVMINEHTFVVMLKTDAKQHSKNIYVRILLCWAAINK